MAAAPVRTCVGCRERRSQAELVRIALLAGATPAVGRRLPGRGAWLCAGSMPCFDTAVRRRALDRALRQKLDRGAIERLRTDFVRSGPAVRD